ncbi:N-acetylmuramoyl-L-alanine amidase [Rhizobiales bacterium GAS191]|nr:N-acetylmuramoyl-L-alanine amidase [Rhizobiales bacterium GAS113]SEE19748.1 N-acetylmuramoyl-L-alanine amidase [Rhizobiales bacterium GAS191]
MSGAMLGSRSERSFLPIGASRRLGRIRAVVLYLCGFALFGGLVAGLAAAIPFPAGAMEQGPAVAVRTVVVAAKLEQTASGARLVFVASQPLTATPFALEKPDRLVLDLPEVNFQLPAHTGEAGTGLVKSFRYGLFGFGRSRVVIDLSAPARIVSAVNAPLLKDLGTTFTIELARADREAFHELAGGAHATSATASSAPVAPARSATPQKDTRPLIVIDPGHGGFDPGAMGGSGEVEKNITLEFATTLAAELERRGHVQVALTRSNDSFVSLTDRARFAHDQNAALFVSIHADTLMGSPHVHGATIYTLADHASDADAARVAEKENRVDQLAGLDSSNTDEEVVSILDDLMKRETKVLSLAFAKKLIQTLEPHVRLNKNPLRAASFVVLRAPDVPSALVELGYLSSEADRASLTSPQWREETARAIATAIEARLPAQPGAAALAN